MDRFRLIHIQYLSLYFSRRHIFNIHSFKKFLVPLQDIRQIVDYELWFNVQLFIYIFFTDFNGCAYENTFRFMPNSYLSIPIPKFIRFIKNNRG
ncbi:hypothetical protein D9M68_512990 [compost metagenome]